MIAAVRRARDHGIATGLISNSWGESRYDADLLRELFDGVVISATVGIRKPAAGDLRDSAPGRCTCEPKECVFVDDLRGNLKPARALGMTTVHHVDAARPSRSCPRSSGSTCADRGPRISMRSAAVAICAHYGADQRADGDGLFGPARTSPLLGCRVGLGRRGQRRIHSQDVGRWRRDRRRRRATSATIGWVGRRARRFVVRPVPTARCGCCSCRCRSRSR